MLRRIIKTPWPETLNNESSVVILENAANVMQFQPWTEHKTFLVLGQKEAPLEIARSHDADHGFKADLPVQT